MTNSEVLAKTIAIADAWLEQELERSEIVLRDQGATEEELQAAFGPDGFVRRLLEQDRDEQIAEVQQWLDGTRH